MEGTMEGFENLGTGVEVGEESYTKKVDSAKKAEDAAKKQALMDRVKNDETFMARYQTLSDSLEVVNSLGFGSDGNIVLANDSTKDNRKIAKTSVIVGYRVLNCGEVPLKYENAECAFNAETGAWEETTVQCELAPGETADIPRRFMTSLCSIPEIAFTLKNGYIKKGSKKDTKSVQEELEAYYFICENAKVNSDSFKINVGTEVVDENDNKLWVVLPEYEKIFGMLNNGKPKAVKGASVKGTGSKLNPRAAAANYIQECLEKNSLL